jgi:Ca2+-binding EF-hand superfamily protein
MNVSNSYQQMQSHSSQQSQKTPPSAEDIFSKIMQETDSDSDGSISADEISAMNEKQQEMLSQADTDGNGTVSEDELLSSIAEQIAQKSQMQGQGGHGHMGPPPSSSDMLSKIMEETDTDGDGSISAEEVSAMDERQQEFLNAADTDGDDIITEDELTTQLESDMQSRQGEQRAELMQNMQDMSLNSFKDLLSTLVEQSEEVQDTASQIEEYLGKLGLEDSQVDDFMSLLENQRFDIKA